MPARVLVIDDEPSLTRALALLLRRDGYLVETAGDGYQALARLQAQRFDVLLCDLRMPRLDGRALYERLRHDDPALSRRVIFLTADAQAADHQTFLARCGQPWLEKPYPIAALRCTLAQMLRGPARAEVLQQKCQALRQRSQALLHTVQTLSMLSAALRHQGASLRGKRREVRRSATA